ncbi:MAG: alpha-amylase/4-alpha-glucanotransferase domain-containing protein, partial [Planctomycetaceae bacterium]
PHLRNAIYHHHIAAENRLEQAAGRTGRWVDVTRADFDLDTHEEIRLAGDRLVAYFAPSRGGHLYELDLRHLEHNLLATLNRRFEAYHEKVIEAGRHQHHPAPNEAGPQHTGHHDAEHAVASIHDIVRFKQPDLDKKIVYDPWPRKTFVDHFLQPGLSLADFQKGQGEVGDFTTGAYEAQVRQRDGRAEVVLSRRGSVPPYQPRVTKTIVLDSARGGTLEALYELEGLPPGLPIHFAVEFNFAGMAAGASDRYYYDGDGRQLGQLESVQELSDATRLGLIDEWLGLDVAVESSRPASLWTFPIQTISQSEGGFELVHQSSAVVPHWEFPAPKDGRWSVRLVLSTDTSAAQARELRETPLAATVDERG